MVALAPTLLRNDEVEELTETPLSAIAVPTLAIGGTGSG